ncbi:MAG TPA: DNA replication/repair protein RecF [Chthonomonadales bacterium]|nr:DNA replication/repair protein RecF [Chthonomonadales bacterium]
MNPFVAERATHEAHTLIITTSLSIESPKAEGRDARRLAEREPETMHIQEIRLSDFRNYATLTLEPGHGVNVLVGRNAQGKSNLLEAIQVLATTRSLRAGRDSELIRKGASQAEVEATVVREDSGEHHLLLSVAPNDRKTVRINGSRPQRGIELLGHLNAVFFGSVDLGVVNAEPSVRRRFLNLDISQISPKYCFDLAAYKRALEQRNRLLREMRDGFRHAEALEAWTEQVVRYGVPILEKRRTFVQRLAPLAAEVHDELTSGRERLWVEYAPNVPIDRRAGLSEIEQAFRACIAQAAQDEMRRGATLVGPQRDDIRFEVDRMDARIYGSQGQQRTVVLSLKLAEFRLMEEYTGEPPVMLMDDVMSDLDDLRRRRLVHWLRRRRQAFVSCTNLRGFPPEVLREATVLRVERGTLTRESSDRVAEECLDAYDAGNKESDTP